MKNELEFTVAEVAYMIMTSTQTVRNYIKNGLLKARHRGPNTSFLIKEKNLDKFLAKRIHPKVKDKKKKETSKKAPKKKKSTMLTKVKNIFYTPIWK